MAVILDTSVARGAAPMPENFALDPCVWVCTSSAYNYQMGTDPRDFESMFNACIEGCGYQGLPLASGGAFDPTRPGYDPCIGISGVARCTVTGTAHDLQALVPSRGQVNLVLVVAGLVALAVLFK